MEFLTQKNDNIVVLRIDFEFTNSNRNLIVFSIRGSTSFRDWWLDLEMYSPSAIFTLIKTIPFIVKDESITSEALNIFLTFPLRMMEDITLLRSYSTKIYNLVDNIIIENKNDSDFIFVGPSLGGGLSKYIASHYQKQSISRSGPGATSLLYKNGWPDGYNKYFKTNFIDVIPDNDIVPRLEISGGTKYRVLCDKDMFSCHSIDRTLCMIGIMCQQEESTIRLCLNMNSTKDEYDGMKELKYGENYCNVVKINSENEKNKCKDGKVSSNEINQQKCCYVHLKYKIDEESEERNEYKCLEFSKGEKENYENAFLKKYVNPEIEFDNCEFP